MYKLSDLDPTKLSAISSTNFNINIRTLNIKHSRLFQKHLYYSIPNSTLPSTSPSNARLKLLIKESLQTCLTEKCQMNQQSKFLSETSTTFRFSQLTLTHLPWNSCTHLKFLRTFRDKLPFLFKISVEAYTKSSPAECFKCQRIDHGSQNCGYVL